MCVETAPIRCQAHFGKRLSSWTRNGGCGSYTITYGDHFSGLLVTETDPLARTKRWQYTVDDRVSKLDYSDTSTPDVDYTYDPWFGRVSTRADGIGTTAYTYNPHDGVTLGAGQQALVNGPFPDDTLRYTYDALGRLSRLQIVDNATQQTASYDEAYTFDARGRVTEVDNNLGLFEYGYCGRSGRATQVD